MHSNSHVLTHLNKVAFWLACALHQKSLYNSLYCHHGSIERQRVTLSSSTCLKLPFLACTSGKVGTSPVLSS
jgi:hypothetical protein